MPIAREGTILVASDKRLVCEQFPRSSQYNPDWVLSNASGGANALWVTEWLTTGLDLRPGMKVLDLGCGRASSSIFLRREFGVEACLYLNYLARFVKPGGPVGIAGAGLMREIDGFLPDHLRKWWTQDLWCLHSAAWWRRHWERTGIMDIHLAEPTQYTKKPLLRSEE